MTEFNNARSEISVEEGIARRRNRRNVYVLCAAATLGAILVAGALLVPSDRVINHQLNSELAANNPPTVVTTPSTPPGRPELLEGTHGGTFIIGTQSGLIGTSMDANDLVNRRDPSAYQGGTYLFRNERVQTVPKKNIFSIGKSPADAVLVYIGPNTQGPLPGTVHEVKPGQNVAVSGTIKPMPSVYTVSNTWGLSSRQLGRLGNTSLYIEANAVQLLTK